MNKNTVPASTNTPSGLDTEGVDTLSDEIRARIRFTDDGLVPAVVQDRRSRDVLMVGWMDEIALARTLSTGRAWYWSRSRQQYWRKGDTSGAIQLVHSAELDCDGDVILLTVTQIDAACHTGTWRCFDAGGALPVTTEHHMV
ncbi:phosphoribosyl-AMP cyclohydrolase [Trueperella sp. LYQ143]|uniref:phosphoribosyl-AMP cyclohydrolase n=1 Tax=unclassified Trueperella TaxID=2630174 RepID=UPI003982F147